MRRGWMPAAVILVAGAAVAVLARDGPSSHVPATVLGERIRVAPGYFAVSGEVAGLYPGGTRGLEVVVENPGAYALRLLALDVAVRSRSAGCPSGSVTVTGFRGSELLAGRARTVAPLAVTMAAAAPDACSGAVFDLVYSGTAVRA